MSKQKNETSILKSNIFYQIIMCVGLLIITASLFIPAKISEIVIGQEIPNFWTAFIGSNQDSIPFIQMLFGHGEGNLISLSPLVLNILILYLPVAVFLASILLFILLKKKIALILALLGLAMTIGIQILLIMTGATCLGLYIGMAGAIVALAGMLLFYVVDEDGDYEDAMAGEISCTSGELAGSKFEISDIVVIGKNPNDCNIVLRNKTISRIHCIIEYIPATETYTVKDVSRNGTFFDDGRPLIKNHEMQVKRETTIYMGEPRESFYLD